MKYQGGKSKYKKFIVPLLQNLINKYNLKSVYVVFCGGVNIEDDLICETPIQSSDHKASLVALLKYVQDGGELPVEIDREIYSDVRSNKNNDKYSSWFIGAVEYLASFNGRGFAGGYGGQAKTKDGGVRNYYDEAKRNLEKQVPKFKNIEFTCSDYRDVEIPAGSLIYCDPPYEGTKEYEGCRFDHEAFWQWVRNKSKNNIVITSEQEAPSDFICIWQHEVTRTMKPDDSKKATERLFVYDTETEF